MILDISEWQVPNTIDYNKICVGLELVIVRVQYGSAYVDKYYKTHIAEFKKRGVPVAVYAWVRGVNNADMEIEATDFWNRAKDFKPTFWFLDVEEQSMPDMRGGCSAYIRKLRALGAKKVGIYIANHLYKKFNLNMAEADAVWIPHYGMNNGTLNSKPEFPCDLHQFTSVGHMTGYAGSLDLNVLTGSKPLNYFTDGQTAAPQPQEPKPTPQGFTITRWYNETGTFIPSEYCWIKYEPTKAAPLCASLQPPETNTYYTVVFCDGHAWLKYTRSNGRVAYICYADSPDGKTFGRKYGRCV